MQSNLSLHPNLKYSKTDIINANEIAYVGRQYLSEVALQLQDNHDFVVDKFESVQDFKAYLQQCSILDTPAILLIEEETGPEFKNTVKQLRENPLTSGAVVILLTGNTSNKSSYQALKVNDVYNFPYNVEMIAERINFLIRFKIVKSNHPKLLQTNTPEYRMAFGKRLLDILVSSLLLIGLSPFLLIVALLVRLSGKGPVIYKSKRAGTGYKIFDFYKFRSMAANADKKLKSLSDSHNQYKAQGSQAQAFVKILNDPRVTKIGSFLRKTSLDELPQLFNVLKGDMSLVGNRPLPLYEAEMLTSDQFAMRFLGPAGITGLWQISKRGKAEMSSEERIALDNHYAKYTSFWMDVKIVLKTIPAMLQKEKV